MGKVLTLALQGLSYSDVERTIRQAKRGAIVQSVPLEMKLRTDDPRPHSHPEPRSTPGPCPRSHRGGLSQREAHEWTGVSRRPPSGSIKTQGAKPLWPTKSTIYWLWRTVNRKNRAPRKIAKKATTRTRSMKPDSASRRSSGRPLRTLNSFLRPRVPTMNR